MPRSGPVLAYVENGVAMAYDRGSAAWTFELGWWGVCGQGPTEEAALGELRTRGGQVRSWSRGIGPHGGGVRTGGTTARACSRGMTAPAWHVVDTESRYYLPSTGLGYREPVPDLLDELEASCEHVRATLATMPADAAVGQGWAAVKLLRRLAWHERGELDVMRAIALRTPRK